MNRARCVLVLGMHRSGTSALAGALGLLGVPLGSRLVPAEADNPGGYFEHADAVQAHERLLLALERGWDDLRPLPEGWLDSAPALAALETLDAMVDRDFADAPLWALKDPRICRLLPLWQRLLERRGIEPAYLFSLRSPDEVAGSLQARDGLPPAYARLLWAQHLVLAERDTRGAARAVVDYPGLLSDPVQALDDAAGALGLAWPVPAAAAADALRERLDPGQRHHRKSPAPGAPGSLDAWVADLHAASLALASAPGELARLGEELEARAWPHALAHAGFCTGLNRSRRQLAALADRLRETEQGLDQARELSLQRLGEVQENHRRLDEVHAALEQTKTLSIERLGRIDDLEAALAAAHADAAALRGQLQEAHEQLRAVNEQVARMEASRSWRLTRPLRALGERLRRLRGDGG